MDGGMGVWKDGRMDGWIKLTDKLMDMNEWMEGWVYGRMGGWMDELDK